MKPSPWVPGGGGEGAVCESIDEISKEEIESQKDDIKSWVFNPRLPGVSLTKCRVDYETYLQQFWLGLLEGDGTITVSSPGPNHVKVRFVISIKNLKENIIMRQRPVALWPTGLMLVKEVLAEQS
jgi:hypothetical protein